MSKSIAVAVSVACLLVSGSPMARAADAGSRTFVVTLAVRSSCTTRVPSSVDAATARSLIAGRDVMPVRAACDVPGLAPSVTWSGVADPGAGSLVTATVAY